MFLSHIHIEFIYRFHIHIYSWVLLFEMAGMKLTQKIVDQWIAECQAVAQRVIADGGELPDFKTLDPRTKDGGSVKSEDWAEFVFC